MGKVITLRDIPRGQAKEEIQQLFQDGKTRYFSDTAEELRLDLELVVGVCMAFMDEGKLVVDEEYLK